MNPETLSLQVPNSLEQTDISTMNFSPTHLFGISIIVIVVSHFGAQYLASITPRGYWFWFTILNIAVGLFFI
ncbi:MAG: hypothetical protein HHAS10_01390 [Candidatus Altimarinota bacterium]